MFINIAATFLLRANVLVLGERVGAVYNGENSINSNQVNVIYCFFEEIVCIAFRRTMHLVQECKNAYFLTDITVPV